MHVEIDLHELDQFVAQAHAAGATGINQFTKKALKDSAELLQHEVRQEAPILTGALKQGVFANISDTFAVVGTDPLKTPYGVYVEFGTKRMRANPFFRRAKKTVDPKIDKIISDIGTEMVRQLARKPI
jgi:HK97 gp10 family phage protein